MIELLVVIAIITMLMGMLLPSLGMAREHSRSLKCQTNLSGMMKGFLMFATDHNDFLPGNTDTSNEAEEWKTDWLGGPGPWRQHAVNFPNKPEKGTIFPYAGKLTLLYRCPSQPVGTLNSGEGSNGRFDYATMQILPGALIQKINLLSRLKRPDGTYQGNLATPIIVEEDPLYSINNGNIEDAHGGIDKMSHVHRGGSSYTSLDGSVHFFIEPAESNGDCWEFQTMQDKWVADNGYSEWGYWNRQ